MDTGKFQLKQQPFSSIFTFRIEQTENGSLMATVLQKDAETGNSTALHRYHHHFQHGGRVQDDVGALYYVVAVILIYGCSILMMIASYIRKNKVDRRLNRYLKEMANVRKRERRMTLMTATAKVAKKDSLVMAEAGSAICTPLPSPNASPSCLGSTVSALNDTGQSGSTADVTSIADTCRHLVTRSAGARQSSASYQFLAVDPPSRQDARRHGGRTSRGGAECQPRASSPVLVISDHHGNDADDDEYNGDSDCSGQGGVTSDHSNSAVDLRASGSSLNIPPISVHTTRRYRQVSGGGGGAGKRRKSVTLCVPGSTRHAGHVVRAANEDTELVILLPSGESLVDVERAHSQPGTPTSIVEPEVDIVGVPIPGVARRAADDSPGCQLMVSSV